MGKIATDASLQEILTLLESFLDTQQNGLEGKIGTLSSLSTSAKGNLVAAINELVTNRGALSGLSTSAKNTLVAAINEVLTKANTATTNVGTLSSLSTTAKGNLVAAINELVSNSGALSGLSTSAKNTLVAAINEVLTKANTATTNVGILSSLKTSAKGTLVAAVNEVYDTNTSQAFSISTHTSDISGLKTRCSDIEAVNTSQASSISTINAKILGIVNGGTEATASMHNAIWRGKRLGKFTATHSTNIRNGTFTDMYLGDYFCDAEGSTWNMYQIIAFDYFYAPSFTNNAHHIVLRRYKKLSTAFNSTNSTTGGYLNSTWRTETKPTLEEQFAADFIDSTHLWHHTEYLSSACSGGKVTGFTTVTDACVELLDERQVTGTRCNGWSEKDSVGTNTCFTKQFPLYSLFDVFGWQSGSCLTRNPISDTQVRMIHNCQSNGWTPSLSTEYETHVYLTVN